METALIIVLPIVTAALTIASFFIARSAETHKKGLTDGTIKTDIEYIKRLLQDVLLEQRESAKKTDNHAERITRLEENTKSAHKRLDTLEHKAIRTKAEKE